MLKKIKIKNLAIVDSLEIEFNSSFNVITGESGSGKTIIYKSINYLFGETFNKKNIREEESICEISGLLNINSKAYEIKRVFSQSKTQNYINNKIVSIHKYLNFINENWESYGQHEQQLLLNKDNHIKYLDLFSKNSDLLIQYKLLFDSYNMINNEIKKIISDNDDYYKNKELYDYQLKELNDLRIDNNEDSILKDKIKAIEENKNISTYLDSLSDISSSSDIFKLLDNSSNKLQDLSNKSSDVENIINQLNSLRDELSDLGYEASKLSKEYYYNQSELDSFQEKLLEINHFKRKYGGTIESILAYKKELEDKASKSEDIDSILENKLIEKNNIKEDLLDKANLLLEKRINAIKKLEKNIRNDLQLMEMKDVEFSVQLGKVAINENGIEECIFNIKTNKGESTKSIGDIVSGGELSRIMMAIKLSINISSKNKIFILDEIDAGLSGKEADSIGNIIQRLSKYNQVICITHLSQIASKANQHLKISKSVLSGRTLCNVDNLNEEEKIKELAEMISGKDITSESISYAKKILG